MQEIKNTEPYPEYIALRNAEDSQGCIMSFQKNASFFKNVLRKVPGKEDKAGKLMQAQEHPSP